MRGIIPSWLEFHNQKLEMERIRREQLLTAVIKYWPNLNISELEELEKLMSPVISRGVIYGVREKEKEDVGGYLQDSG